ncbi:MAG: TPM domain-containing protein [Bacteroidota bacterium]
MQASHFWKSISLFAIIFIGIILPLSAKQIPSRPSPPRLVNDLGNILSVQQQRALERKLVAYNDSTSTQIAIVTEKSLGGDDLFDYTIRLAEAWGMGQADKDNGILIYVASEDRKLRILTGYGVEGFLPDAAAKRIVDGVIVPQFREGRYYQGLNDATTIIMELGSGEYTADHLRTNDDGEGIPPIVIFILIIVVFVIISRSQNNGGGGGRRYHDDDGGYYRGGRYQRTSRRGGGWVVLPGGGWNPGGGGGGFDGGDFGGFGGGSFGGGGAGGSW